MMGKIKLFMFIFCVIFAYCFSMNAYNLKNYRTNTIKGFSIKNPVPSLKRFFYEICTDVLSIIIEA